MKFRKITIEEFEKLKRLFPDNEDMWIKYKKKRLEQFEKKSNRVNDAIKYFMCISLFGNL